MNIRTYISYYLRKASHDLFGIVDHRDETKYVAVFDERVGPKNSDHTVSILHHYICHSGLVPSWVRRVCIFMDNATSTNKNRYILGWSMELIQHGMLDLIRIPFLITGHTKFAPDRVFASIGSSYIHSDVFNVDELVTVAGHFSTAVEDSGDNVFHWRQELDKKYTELHGIRKYHDFVVSRDAANDARLRVREKCGSGAFKIDNLKLRSGSSSLTVCTPDPSSNYLNSRRPLSSEKLSDMVTMYSRFIDPDRWPTYISAAQDDRTTGQSANTGPASSTDTSTTSVRGKKSHCSTQGCDGTGHKNIQRWSQGHKTRAGCPIYHGVSPP